MTTRWPRVSNTGANKYTRRYLNKVGRPIVSSNVPLNPATGNDDLVSRGNTFNSSIPTKSRSFDNSFLTAKSFSAPDVRNSWSVPARTFEKYKRPCSA